MLCVWKTSGDAAATEARGTEHPEDGFVQPSIPRLSPGRRISSSLETSVPDRRQNLGESSPDEL